MTETLHVTMRMRGVISGRAKFRMASVIHRAARQNQLYRRVYRLSCCLAYNRKQYSQFMTGKTIRIGCASGFWGDSTIAAPQLIHRGKLDFLVFDYLSEITMSLLIAAKNKQEDMGYAPDFVQIAMAPSIKDIKEKGIKVISNAGGVNPQGCARALHKVCADNNVDLNIAVVTGDDLIPELEQLRSMDIREVDSDKPLPKHVHSMNAYLGAGPIAKALDLGADVVITGRCVDSALVLAPLIHTYGWTLEDFNHLAAGSLAGHLIECGAQVTGGIFTDWHKVHDWDHIGFPIVECSSDGGFLVTKPKGTGGLVSKATVSEQLLYELGDPARYFLPDVCCDFTGVTLEQIDGSEGQAVYVSGAKGNPPTGEYKVSATYADGFRSTAVACVGGPRSKAKATKTAEEIIKRCQRIYKQLGLGDFTAVHLEVLGSEHIYGPMSQRPEGGRDAVMWLAVHHKNRKALEFFAKEIAPAGTGMAPGLTGIVGGRPRVTPVLKLFSFLYPRDKLKVDINMNGNHIEEYKFPSIPMADYPVNTNHEEETVLDLPKGGHSYRLEDLAYTRSGDKGDTANIGVIARHPAVLPYLKNALTSQAVEQYFHHLFTGNQRKVQRYNVPGIHGMNFVLHQSLGGGGIASLRSDPQGKAYGQMLLDFEVSGVPDLSSYINEASNS
ncbi:hypothetical protein FSP39_017866 [Pinctada imbricata]|uniref:Terpene utilization protein AtuA n=1 Tax=Pinctada imbricata TaxID=66713 RepID=A0AA88YIX1_PINIB|nr:hypothetical protein FSP39_017866 [Pinctada imbricata]